MNLRARLATLVVVTLLPVVAFAGIMVAVFARQEQAAIERGARDTTRALSLAVDRELETSLTTLQVLGTSTRLDVGDLDGFYRQTERARNEAHPAWETVALADPAGRLLLMLRAPLGTSFPSVGDRDYFQRAVETRRPVVSDLGPGPSTPEPMVVLAVPVQRGGAVRYVVLATIRPAAWTTLLAEQRLPEGWAARILDRQQVTIARVPADPARVGQRSVGEFDADTRGRAEGWVRYHRPGGSAVYIAFTRSALSGWALTVGIPAESVEGALRQSLWLVAGGGLLFLAVGLVVAALVGRRLAAPIQTLARAAETLGRGEPLPPVARSRITEVDQLAHAVEAASGARRRAEAELRRAETRWFAMLQSIGDAVIATDAAGRVTFMNGMAESLTGWPAAEAAGRDLGTVCCLLDAESGAPIEHLVARVLGQGEAVARAAPCILISRDGRQLPIDDRGAPIRDEHGAIVGTVFVFRDISERRRVEAEQERLRTQLLELEQARYREAQRGRREAEAVAELARRIGAAPDLSEILQLVVQTAREMTGSDLAHIALRDPRTEGMVFRYWAGDRVRGEQPYEVTPGRGIGGQVLLTGRPFRTDDYVGDPRISRDYHEVIRAEGIVASMAVPIRIGERVEGLLFVDNRARRPFTDRDEAVLTNLADHAAVAIRNVQLLRRAEEARGEAEAASLAKDTFLAMLGHELRNPLGAIANALRVLERVGKQEERVVRLRSIISRQTHHLARLVDDLLDVTRLRTGKIQLQRQPVDLRGVAEHGLASLHEAGKTAGHTMALTGEAVWVDGDPTRLEQVVWNLLDNAVKYTPPGGRIDVVVEREGDEAVLRVRDSGTGIAADVLPRIFDLFVQAHASLDRTQGGLGLGLSLVRRLVELHGGRVEASSDGPGRGSEFVIRLRARATAGVPRSADVSTPVVALARHVLVVEDNADVRDGLRLLLEDCGHQVDEAADGLTGLQLALAQRPDVVLVDVGLPGLDGYDVARRIRAAPDTELMVLVALTGYGQPEDRRRALAAGFDAHLVKPVDPDALLRFVAEGRAPASRLA
jgi:PAS domain S-box-containing protein